MATKKKATAKPSRNKPAAPVFRTAIAAGEEKITFKVNGGYRLETPGCKSKIQRITQNRIWRVQRQESNSARFAFSLNLGRYESEAEAEELLEQLEADGHEVDVSTVGVQLELGSFTHDNRRFQVNLGSYDTEAEARAQLEELSRYEPTLIRRRVKEAGGRFEIFDLEYDKHTMVDDICRLIPETPESRLIMLKARIHPGNQRSEKEDLVFGGGIEFRLENGGLMLAVNEVDMEDYVLAVVASEQDSDYPREALKAKAIAVRSLGLAKLGHQHPNDDYDFCAFDHCQMYRGVGEVHDQQRKAVSMTRGRVVLFDDKVASTWYSPVCGGHLEDGKHIFDIPALKYLTGFRDKSDRARRRDKVDLSRETNIRDWINSEPNTYCHVTERLSQQVYEQSRRYYRWRESYQRREIEDVITRNTGVDIGTLYEIIPIRRGVSGRILEMEIIGSRDNVLIKGERRIRQTLSSSELLSSCFHVEVEYTDLNEPLNFIFHGAGCGHGVGMCETGAGTLAVDKGMKYQDILAHYYTGTIIKKIYS